MKYPAFSASDADHVGIDVLQDLSAFFPTNPQSAGTRSRRASVRAGGSERLRFATRPTLRWAIAFFLAVSTSAQVPSAGNSTMPSAITLRSGGPGVAGFSVTVRDAANLPVVGAAVLIDLSACGVTFCPSQPPGHSIAGDQVNATTSASGIATFCICGNAPSMACSAPIYANGVLLGSRPVMDFLAARGSRSLTSEDVWSGSVNGAPVTLASTATYHEATGRVIQDLPNVPPTFAQHLKPKRGKKSPSCCSWPANSLSIHLGIAEVNGGNWDSVTKYTQDSGEVMIVTSQVRAVNPSPGFTMKLAMHSVFSGTAAVDPLSAVIVHSPIVETWHQSGPGVITMQYTHHYTVNGVPRYMLVEKTVTYEGSGSLGQDQARLEDQILSSYDSQTQLLHDEGTITMLSTVPAGHTAYGVGCYAPAPLTLTASPAPVYAPSGPSAPVTYTLTNVIDIVPPLGVGLPLLAFSIAPINPGIDLGFVGMPGCNLNIASLDVILAMPNTAPTSSLTIAFPQPLSPGLSFFAQGVSLFAPFSLPNGENSFGGIMSNGLQSRFNTF